MCAVWIGRGCNKKKEVLQTKIDQKSWYICSVGAGKIIRLSNFCSMNFKKANWRKCFEFSINHFFKDCIRMMTNCTAQSLWQPYFQLQTALTHYVRQHIQQFSPTANDTTSRHWIKSLIDMFILQGPKPSARHLFIHSHEAAWCSLILPKFKVTPLPVDTTDDGVLRQNVLWLWTAAFTRLWSQQPIKINGWCAFRQKLTADQVIKADQVSSWNNKIHLREIWWFCWNYAFWWKSIAS